MASFYDLLESIGDPIHTNLNAMRCILEMPPYDICKDWISHCEGCEDRFLNAYEPACSLDENARRAFTQSTGLSWSAEGIEIETFYNLFISSLVYDPS